jgi:hypothetical protein
VPQLLQAVAEAAEVTEGTEGVSGVGGRAAIEGCTEAGGSMSMGGDSDSDGGGCLSLSAGLGFCEGGYGVD